MMTSPRIVAECAAAAGIWLVTFRCRLRAYYEVLQWITEQPAHPGHRRVGRGAPPRLAFWLSHGGSRASAAPRTARIAADATFH